MLLSRSEAQFSRASHALDILGSTPPPSCSLVCATSRRRSRRPPPAPATLSFDALARTRTPRWFVFARPAPSVIVPHARSPPDPLSFSLRLPSTPPSIVHPTLAPHRSLGCDTLWFSPPHPRPTPLPCSFGRSSLAPPFRRPTFDADPPSLAPPLDAHPATVPSLDRRRCRLSLVYVVYMIGLCVRVYIHASSAY
ncbi:hypothetical protein R3P38DRAFT_3181561 [Favolaschia claudopus]|uniref:Uncharacterized protein n=1 Tax=Favolaschia claudopus TaxID=2862362 RepID=A0AAW0CMW7_9AGAR